MTLQVKAGTSLGGDTIPAGLPGGAGGAGGPPAPNLGAGWEVKVLAAPDFHTMLAVIPQKVLTGWQFAKQLKDLGSGTVTLDMDDLFWTSVTLTNGQPAHYLLDFEHVWQFWQDGVCRFEFLGETVTEALADTSEQRIATVTGPGTIATLKWAMAAPPGFPGAIRYKLDAISDGFSETDINGNLVLDTGLWNAASPTSHLSLNPSGSCRIMGSTGTTYLGTTAYDATNTLVSAQITPIVSPDAAGASLDGSQVTQMYVQSLANSSYYALIGMSGTTLYAQLGDPSGVFTQAIASAVQYNTAAAGTNVYAYWQISEANGTFYFWTSSDGQTWAKQFQVAHGWDATNCALYFTAKYDVDNTEFATVTSINSNVSTSSLGGPVYFSQPIIGGVWMNLLEQAQARGTVPFITTGQLGASTDSFGNPWNDSQSVQIANGTDMFTLLGAHASMINADWVMQPGFLLQVGIPETGKITLGADRSGQVVFRDGQDCTARVRTRARQDVSNLLGVINSDGRTITATDSTSVTAYGQREAWLQAAMQVTPADLDAVAVAADLENATEVLSWTLQVSPWRPGRDIFNSYDVGDWVGLERPDFSAIDVVRVAAIAVQVAADGSETHELTLVSYIQWLQEQLSYIMTKLGGGLVSAAGTTAVAGSITSQNAPTVFSLTLGSLGDVTTGGPGGGAPLVYDPVTGQWMPAGSTNALTGNVPLTVSGSGGQVTIAGDGSSVTVGGLAAPPPDVGTPVPAATTTTTPTGIVHADANGVTRVVIGVQSDGTVTITEVNGPAPAAPSTPIVTGALSAVVVGWDGLLGGAAPLLDFLWTEVHVSTSTGFTPSSATLQGTMVAGGVFGVGSLLGGTTYYVKLVARNKSRVASAASTQASAAAITPGAGSGAKVTIASTAPGSPATGDLWYDTSNGNRLNQWTGSAWTAYQYGTAAIATGAITSNEIANATIVAGDISATAGITGTQLSSSAGITGTQLAANTITVSQLAGTVTARALGGITTTISLTAPGSPTTGDIWINTTTGVIEQWSGSAWVIVTFNAANAIQAGTVTATQILANTITATQLAAGAVTTSVLAANAVTAAKIAANTITAGQIAANTITATQLAAGIIYGTIVDGTVITGSTLQNSGSNPRTSINPDGSVSITNSSGTVIFKIGPDGTIYWYNSVGILMMELQPGGATLIYGSATGPTVWDFEGSTQSWAGTNATLTDDSTWSSTGVDSLKVTHSNTSQPWGATSPAFPVTANTLASMTCVLHAPSTTITGVTIGFTFFSGTGGGGTNLGSVTGDQGTFSVTSAADITATITGATVPATAQSAVFFVHSTLTTSSVIINIDSVSVAGGLVYSLSPIAGTDGLGNPYDQGVTFTGLPGLTNVLSVKDPYGNKVAGLDSQGNVSGQVINAVSDLQVGGVSVPDLIDGVPSGIVNRGWAPLSGSFPWPSTAITTAETSVLEVDQVLSAGRAYKISVLPCEFEPTTATGNWFVQRLRATTDGSTPSTSSTQLIEQITPVNQAITTQSAYSDYLTPSLSSDTPYRFLLTAFVHTGSFKYGSSIELRVEDIGPWLSQTNANNGVTLGSGTSGGSGAGVVTANYFATATYAYYGATAAGGFTANGLADTNGNMYQSCGSAQAFTKGDMYSFAMFDYATIASDLSGATINSVKLRLKCTYSYYSSGMTAIVGWTSGAPGGATYVPGAGTHENTTHYHINEGSVVLTDITATGIGTQFQSGGATGIVIGPASSYTSYTDQNNNGILQGGTTGYCPMLQFNYTT